jgi:hypothetical protein
MIAKSDVSGSVWDWQRGIKTDSADGAGVPLSADLSFRVWFEHQLIGGQGPPELPGKDHFKVTSLKTGSVGYVKFYLTTVESVALVDAQGDIVHFVIHGYVRLTWEEKDG